MEFPCTADWNACPMLLPTFLLRLNRLLFINNNLSYLQFAFLYVGSQSRVLWCWLLIWTIDIDKSIYIYDLNPPGNGIAVGTGTRLIGCKKTVFTSTIKAYCDLLSEDRLYYDRPKQWTYTGLTKKNTLFRPVPNRYCSSSSLPVTIHAD